jgi:hypothetical protein
MNADSFHFDPLAKALRRLADGLADSAAAAEALAEALAPHEPPIEVSEEFMRDLDRAAEEMGLNKEGN